MTFDRYVGIDYSGAEASNSRVKGLQVYETTDGLPERIIAHAEEGRTHWKWSRQEVAQHLLDLVSSGTRFIVGLDHNFSFPLSYFERYELGSWDEFLDDFAKHWPTHRPNTYVDFIRDRPPGPTRVGFANEYRLCERRTSSAKSVFQFDCQGQVAKSSHAGIPWLWHIRRTVGDHLHFWPFDGWDVPENKSVLAEVYPSILRNRYPPRGPHGGRAGRVRGLTLAPGDL